MSFFQSDVRVEKLAKWLDWAGELDKSVFVALPMIQRGSVWKPGQIIDLWDSLLQSMPIGSLMISELEPNTPVRRQGEKKFEPVPAGGGLGLVDGQQRTLAMLAAWPEMKMDRRIWVDFADVPTAGHLLALRVTSTNHPFGFRRDDPSAKLSLDDRRKALAYHEHGLFSRQDDAEKPPATVENTWPFSHTPCLPIDLRWLIKTWRSDPALWEEAVLKEIELIKTISEASSIDKIDAIHANAKLVKCNWPMGDVSKRIGDLRQALTRLFQMELPLIRVDNRFFDITIDDNNEPPLAVLFKRIGTGGTRLSDADYVYSIIKHLHPKTYDLVESLYESKSGAHNVASLLNATDLVMSAVRLAAVNWEHSDGKPFPDKESPSKPDFHKLLKRGDFLKERFLPLIEATSSGKSPIVVYFDQVQNCLEYDQRKNDIGLPLHLFPHIGRPLVQVLLRIAQTDYLEKVDGELLLERRYDMVRLVLFWMVAVNDPKKASELAYQVIKHTFDLPPKERVPYGKAICIKLIEEGGAVKLIYPSLIKQRVGLATSSNPELLSSDVRFTPAGSETDYKSVYEFYRRWWQPWTYRHPMLLWLQREHVATMVGNPMAGRDEDTPYDYDHILPSSHWGNWQGTGFPPSFGNGKIYVVGNGIGNVRVWDSSSNRRDGDVAPDCKLKLRDEVGAVPLSLPTSKDLLRWSAISDLEEHKKSWRDCSKGDADKKNWDLHRVSAFQTASESRAFHLYERYFSEPNFADWFGVDATVCDMEQAGQLEASPPVIRPNDSAVECTAEIIEAVAGGISMSKMTKLEDTSVD